VVVVTGGGGGIGAAVAEELGRQGAFVVTVDPLVTLDGVEVLPATEDTTAGRIVAAGGAARASSVSVNDRDAIRDLFEELVAERGRLDAVVNVAGITRPTSFTRGADEDWRAVLEVHLDGYLNILRAALPIMAAAGYGRILGVTSGSGWRPADAGAYACAKRAVASLTWLLGDLVPVEVAVNAMSPIAVTRMVTAALGRAPRPAGGSTGAGASTGSSTTSSGGSSTASSTGGLSLGSMPAPADLGPIGAHLVGDDLSWCRGQVVFVGGSEVAVIGAPRLIEVVRSADVADLSSVLDAFTAGALVPAEAAQASTGGSNPRFGSLFDDPGDGSGDDSGDDFDDPGADASERAAAPGGAGVMSCALLVDRPDLAAAVESALDARSVSCRPIVVEGSSSGFAGPAAALAAHVEREGPVDAVVVARSGPTPVADDTGTAWSQVLAEHEGIVDQIHGDAAWARAVADVARRDERAVRLVTLTDATTAGGRSRAQAAAQLARAGLGATDDRVAAFAVSIETGDGADVAPIGELVAHLVASPDGPALSGAELVVGAGWIGLRNHPHPTGSITFGGPEIPAWFDDPLRRIVGDHS
jgi:NAD(P)-dependent dehydrogenase (short-subunit alcohol dehydrogenase family)